jgi:hypothetical protein
MDKKEKRGETRRKNTPKSCGDIIRNFLLLFEKQGKTKRKGGKF